MMINYSLNEDEICTLSTNKTNIFSHLIIVLYEKWLRVLHHPVNINTVGFKPRG